MPRELKQGITQSGLRQSQSLCFQFTQKHKVKHKMAKEKVCVLGFISCYDQTVQGFIVSVSLGELTKTPNSWDPIGVSASFKEVLNCSNSTGEVSKVDFKPSLHFLVYSCLSVLPNALPHVLGL